MRFGWLVWASLFIGGCASDDEPASFDEGRRAACHGACVGWQRCGLAGSTCESACFASYQPRGVRGSALVRIGDCLAQESCEVLASDESFAGCAERVAETEPVRDALLSYCQSAALGNFNCSRWWEIEDCTQTMSLWEDGLLARAESCHSLACDELYSCEEAAFRSP